MESLTPPFQQSYYDGWHYSPIMLHEGIALLSGVTGMREDGTFAHDAEEQCRDLFRSLGRVLQHGGMSFADVLEMTSYHCDMTEMPAFMRVRDEFVVEPWPAWTAVGVSALASPDARFEVRVIGRVPSPPAAATSG